MGKNTFKGYMADDDPRWGTTSIVVGPTLSLGRSEPQPAQPQAVHSSPENNAGRSTNTEGAPSTKHFQCLPQDGSRGTTAGG